MADAQGGVVCKRGGQFAPLRARPINQDDRRVTLGLQIAPEFGTRVRSACSQQTQTETVDYLGALAKGDGHERIFSEQPPCATDRQASGDFMDGRQSGTTLGDKEVPHRGRPGQPSDHDSAGKYPSGRRNGSHWPLSRLLLSMGLAITCGF